MQTKPVRRIVTGHDEAGRAVVTSDALLDGRLNPTGSTLLTLVWTTAGSPVDNDDPADGRDRTVGLTLPGGTVLRVVDLLPGRQAPMHRTNSLDYGVVVSGAIELLLDDGAVTLAEAGDIIIQRGTIHGWRNPSSDTTARVVFALLDATPATANGAPLPAILPGAAAK